MILDSLILLGMIEALQSRKYIRFYIQNMYRSKKIQILIEELQHVTMTPYEKAILFLFSIDSTSSLPGVGGR